MVNFDLSEDQSLFTLYTAACAPLLTECMKPDNEYFEDIAPISNIISELENLERYINLGLKPFRAVYKQQRSHCSESFLLKQPEMVVALSSVSAFTKRISMISSKLSQMCSLMTDKYSVDTTEVTQKLENRVREGDRPLNPACITVLDLDSDSISNWSFLDSNLKNKVGFKTTTAVISEGKVEEEALKDNKANIQRRRQRNPTGFHKFNFKGFKHQDFEEDLEEQSCKNTTFSTDAGSTGGSLSYPHTDTFTSRSASSVHDDDISIDTYEHKNSSVSFFNPKEERQIIQDENGDEAWEEEQRHFKRFFRIRNRVPTGHPSLMRGTSDELAEIVNKYTQTLEDSVLDSTAKSNAQANRNIPSSPS